MTFFLLEKESELGGMARRIHSTLEGLDVQTYLNKLIRKVLQHPRIHIYMRAAILEAGGYVGNFLTKVASERGVAEIKHGVTIIAVGAELSTPDEYLYGRDDRVMTHLELEQRINNGNDGIAEAETLVMIQCVGCRNADRNYCSRICCSQSIKNALKLKVLNPRMEIYILYRDMRTYGFKEGLLPRSIAARGALYSLCARE